MDLTLQFPKIAIRIIQEQELVIGPLAWDEAKKVVGLTVDQFNESVSFSGDPKEILNKLVLQYERLFGKLSDEVCKDAVKDLVSQMSPEEIPSSLK